MTEEPREPTIERTDAPIVHDRTGAVVDTLRENTGRDATAMAEVTTPLSADYHKVTQADIERCSPLDLVHYSTQAQAAKDWPAAVIFWDALVKLQPENARANLFLSIALERIGRYADALVVWEHTIDLPNYVPDPRDAIRSVRLREKMTGARSASVSGARPVRYDLPSSHLEITSEMLTLCTPCDLIRYSRQAQKDELWGRVEMFQLELVKRQPNNIVAHIQLANAFVKQEKMEDAAALMTTIEELRTSRDNVKVIRAILDLKRWLNEIAAKTQARQQAENLTLTLPALSAPNPVLHQRPDSAPTPRKLSNIDISRFDHFLASIQREVEGWPQIQGKGEGWRKIPEDESNFFAEAFAEFRKQLERAILKGPNRAFWGKFDDMELQFQRGALNMHALATLIERAENAASGAKIDFGRLEPIRIKSRA